MARPLRVEFPGAIYHVTCRMIGERKALGFVEYAPILAEMSGKRRSKPKQYREFVERGLADEDEDFKEVLKESPRSIGGEGFRAWIDELYQDMITRHRRPADAAFRRITEPLTAEAVLSILAEVLQVSVDEFHHRRRDSVLRGMAGRFLVRYAGVTQREAAERLGGVGGDAVGRQMRKVRELLDKDRSLRRLVESAEERLDQLHQSMSKPQRTKALKWR